MVRAVVRGAPVEVPLAVASTRAVAVGRAVQAAVGGEPIPMEGRLGDS